jgi:UTP--glucose-1-phosphate uridylyltransferase
MTQRSDNHPSPACKAVITAAGLGTSLLSATKEQLKEMLPLFTPDGGDLCLKRAVQTIFEQLFDFGFRESCFVVGKGKRAIEDHFTPDRNYIRDLSTHGKSHQVLELNRFYDKIRNSSTVWVNQSEPLGFDVSEI